MVQCNVYLTYSQAYRGEIKNILQFACKCVNLYSQCPPWTVTWTQEIAMRQTIWAYFVTNTAPHFVAKEHDKKVISINCYSKSNYIINYWNYLCPQNLRLTRNHYSHNAQ